MSFPDIKKVYGLKINTLVYGVENLELLDSEGFSLFKIATAEPHKVWEGVRSKLVDEFGEEEVVKRANTMFNNMMKRKRK